MIENYQQEQELELPEPEDATFAIIEEIFEDGVTLIFPPETKASPKRYQTNTSVFFHAGDTVRVIKYSGTYVAEYIKGPPRLSEKVENAVQADTAKKADNAAKLNGKEEANLSVASAAKATSATSADTAKTADNAKKLNGAAEGDLKVKEFSSRHTGAALGFFNHAVSGQQQVESLSTSAETSTIISRINQLITALKNYGLIR